MSVDQTFTAALPEPPAISPIPPHSRNHSVSSERPSAKGLLVPPPLASPEPVYIAPSAASQIVTNDHDSHLDVWYDQYGIEPSADAVLVASTALRLVNNFLDQLLFNFISVARSTSLASLRPAVSEVLKPKLAKDAIAGADLELQEYLGGGEEEELLAFHNGREPSGDWDPELVWKRTRLRCMVYSSLGDMEEEDEDYHTEQARLDDPPGSNHQRFSGNPSVVSPAVAIFLTSILEFMGEQALIIAGQAAYQRLRARYAKEERDGTISSIEMSERVVVDEMDMERVALDRTLGRLWRGWKKRIRSSSVSMSIPRSYSRETIRSRDASRQRNYGNEKTSVVGKDTTVLSTTQPRMAEDLAASTPLPESDDDTRESETSGPTVYTDEPGEEKEEDEEDKTNGFYTETVPLRPQSLLVFPSYSARLPTPNDSGESTPAFLSSASRKRSYSEPSPAASAGTTGFDRQKWSQFDSTIDEGPATSTAEHPKGRIEDPSITNTNDDITKGPLPGTHATAAAENSGDEDLTEEPEIMTSARVSVGSAHSPEPTVTLSKHPSVRAPSIHSLRLVEVGPRSPHMKRDSGEGLVSAATSASTTSSDRRSGSTTSVTNNAPISQGRERSAETSVRIPDRSALRDDVITRKPQTLYDSDPSAAASATVNPLTYQEPQFPYEDAPEPSPEPETATNGPKRKALTVAPYLTISRNSENGVPPLTPLREMMEGATDTADEASSIALSETTYDVHPSSVASVSPISATPSYDHIYPSEPQREVVRLSQPPAQRESEMSRKPRAFSGSHGQPQHSGTGLSSALHKLRPLRTSEDSTARGVTDKGMSLEELIQSDDTIQFTLTPQSMRQIESDVAQKSPLPQSPSFKTNGESPKQRKNSHGSVTRTTGLRSNPPAEALRPNSSRPVSKASSRVRSIAAQARDARAEHDSISDFAEFIRTTGPPGEITPTSASSAQKPQSPTSLRGDVSASRVASTPVSSNVGRVAPPAIRKQLQAREAVVPNNDSSELIDFIRQGPPRSSNNDDPRISRTVAPFRTTMDSDQMTSTAGGRALDTTGDVRRSQASTNASIERSIQSSANSQSALLSHNPLATTSRPFPKASSPVKVDSFDDSEDAAPKRKQRRVRDPYAIDLSDEDDDGLDVSSKAKKPMRQEESLIDFLNSVPPPPEAPTRLFETAPKSVSKKASSRSLIGRFSRSGSTSAPATRKTLVKSPSISTSRPESRVSTRTAQGATYTPIVTQYSDSTTSLPNPANQTKYAGRPDSERRPATRSRVAQQTYQPREATTQPRNQAQDLADFFSNTAPPPDNNADRNRAPAAPPKEQNGFSRVFGRRKKVPAM
ncbi:MAG: hypothetical protein M1818_004153 [Claussenomyces sp. TS43310]|nr:MAG: hypothetical protein M1818_004153 [Claussenomyces sp. TS43310]